MTRLDGYVLRIVLGALVSTLLFFLFLLIVVDLLNNLPKYAGRAADQGLGGFQLAAYLGLYYLQLLPVLFTTVTPFATVIAGMFAVARLHHANEIVPMLFVGRSIHRVLQPMLWCGAGAALAMVVCWQWVVPSVGASLATQEAFLKEGATEQTFLVYERHDQGVDEYLYARGYDPVQRTMRGVSMLVQGDLSADVSLTRAEMARWDDEERDWRLENGWLVRTRLETPQQWLERPDVTPALLVQQARDDLDADFLSYTDLLDLAASRPNRPDVRLALHRHVTYPLANLLLLLLALPMAVRYERGSRIDRILAAIGLCGGYMLLDLTCQSAGLRGWLHPVVAAWTPTIVFGSLGIVTFSSTRT